MTTPQLKLLQVDLTDECPLFCGHCSNSSGPGRSTHFPAAMLTEILGDAKSLGAQTIVYSGGEPLRYPSLEQALSAARNCGISATIFTTGIADKNTRLSIPPERWRDLKDLGLSGARFSVYSAPSHKDLHNSIVRSRPTIGDAFGVNEQAIREAQSAGITAEIHFVPSGASVNDLTEIHSWASHLGCATLHLQIPTYQGRNKDRPLLELNSEEEALLRETALALRASPGDTGLYISRFWLSRWEGTTNESYLANLEQLVIRTDGVISPNNACKYGSVTLEPENILAPGATLADIWRCGRTLRGYRNAQRRAQSRLGVEHVLATPRVDGAERPACG